MPRNFFLIFCFISVTSSNLLPVKGLFNLGTWSHTELYLDCTEAVGVYTTFSQKVPNKVRIMSKCVVVVKQPVSTFSKMRLFPSLCVIISELVGCTSCWPSDLAERIHSEQTLRGWKQNSEHCLHIAPALTYFLRPFFNHLNKPIFHLGFTHRFIPISP